MNAQAALFRVDDPPTAVAAGESVRPHLSNMQAEILGLICSHLVGVTAYEIWQVLNRNGRGRQQNSVCRRCRELEVAGFVTDTGETRVSPLTGRQLIVWEATQAGREAVR